MIKKYFPRGQGAGFSPKPNIREARWLKQLKVAINRGKLAIQSRDFKICEVMYTRFA
jgi:hypothetical protein